MKKILAVLAALVMVFAATASLAGDGAHEGYEPAGS